MRGGSAAADAARQRGQTAAREPAAGKDASTWNASLTASLLLLSTIPRGIHFPEIPTTDSRKSHSKRTMGLKSTF